MPRQRLPVVLVTGASQGIGAAIAEVFARGLKASGGCRLALVARNAAKLRSISSICSRAGAGEVEPFVCDVTDPAAVEVMARDVRSHFGEIDVLINNAGSYAPVALLSTPIAQFDSLLATNLRSAFLVTREFAPAMVQRKRGDIFLLASVASIRAFPAGGAYVAAKHGLLGVARALREELKPNGVRVTAILPGATLSPSWRGSGVPASRMMPAEDIAQTILATYRLSRRTVVEEIVLRPQLGDI